MIEHLSLSASKPEWGESSSHPSSQSVRHVTSHHTFIGIDCESCSTHHHPQITSSTSFRDTLWLMLGWWKEQIAPHKLHLILSVCLTPRRWWGWGHDQEQNWAMDDKFTSQSSGWDPRHIHYIMVQKRMLRVLCEVFQRTVKEEVKLATYSV